MFLCPIAIVTETLVLWSMASLIGLLGNFWRAVLLYIAARAGETVAVFGLNSIPMFQYSGWGLSTLGDFAALAIYLALGLLLAVAVGSFLYRRKDLKPWLVVITVCMASLAGYFSAAGYAHFLFWIVGY
jgi:hypothetical protein